MRASHLLCSTDNRSVILMTAEKRFLFLWHFCATIVLALFSSPHFCCTSFNLLLKTIRRLYRSPSPTLSQSRRLSFSLALLFASHFSHLLTQPQSFVRLKQTNSKNWCQNAVATNLFERCEQIVPFSNWILLTCFCLIMDSKLSSSFYMRKGAENHFATCCSSSVHPAPSGKWVKKRTENTPMNINDAQKFFSLKLTTLHSVIAWNANKNFRFFIDSSQSLLAKFARNYTEIWNHKINSCVGPKWPPNYRRHFFNWTTSIACHFIPMANWIGTSEINCAMLKIEFSHYFRINHSDNIDFSTNEN